MESLQANYRDEDDDDDDEEEQQNVREPITVAITNNQIPSTPISINSDEVSDEVSDEDQLSDEDLQQQQSLNPISIPSQSSSIPLFPPLKKHKTLSELPNSNSISKKPKKKPKSNSVWTKSSSRKGKKKTKSNSLNGSGSNHHHNAHKVFDEMSVTVSPLPRLHLLADKSDDSLDMRICLSKIHKAEKVELSEDRMCAGSSKGYRMVRATRGVVKGAWYYEIRVEKLGETGHTRVGWSTEKGDLQAPVGYDGSSFGYRDIDGCKIHKAMREMYGECGYVEGDVIGHYISLPEGDLYAPKTANWVLYKGQKYASPSNGKEDANKVVSGSEISFFKNGVCQGVAFKDINGGCYYPAASMYTLPNQPNCQVKFNFGPDFDFFPNDFGDRPLPTPMFEVPYQVFDGIIENTESTGEKLQQSS